MRVYASCKGPACAAGVSYLGPYDWPLWRWWLCWWRSGESRSLLPPWVKNGRCSAACGGWRHPAQAWSSHTMTGNTPQGKGERRGGVEKRASNKEEDKRKERTEEWKMKMSRRSVKKERRMIKGMGRGGGGRGREKREKTKTVMQIPWQETKAILLAHSDQGWVIKRHRQRESAI